MRAAHGCTGKLLEALRSGSLVRLAHEQLCEVLSPGSQQWPHGRRASGGWQHSKGVHVPLPLFRGALCSPFAGWKNRGVLRTSCFRLSLTLAIQSQKILADKLVNKTLDPGKQGSFRSPAHFSFLQALGQSKSMKSFLFLVLGAAMFALEIRLGPLV